MPTSRKPLVLISGSTEQRGVEFDDLSLSISMNYARAIQAGGGLPWVAPCIPDNDLVRESVARSDGVLLTGGDDLDPRLYRKNVSEQIAKTVHAADPQRDVFELMLVDEVFRQKKP